MQQHQNAGLKWRVFESLARCSVQDRKRKTGEREKMNIKRSITASRVYKIYGWLVISWPTYDGWKARLTSGSFRKAHRLIHCHTFTQPNLMLLCLSSVNAIFITSFRNNLVMSMGSKGKRWSEWAIWVQPIDENLSPKSTSKRAFDSRDQQSMSKYQCRCRECVLLSYTPNSLILHISTRRILLTAAAQ